MSKPSIALNQWMDHSRRVNEAVDFIAATDGAPVRLTQVAILAGNKLLLSRVRETVERWKERQ